MAGISTKGFYGVIATLYIYKHEKNGAIKSVSISKEVDLPQNYLEQILLVLKNANILKSIRGAKGGYMLARDPKEITVLSIIEALDGVICDFETGARKCNLELFWSKTKSDIRELFNISLVQLEKHYIDPSESFNFMI